MFIRPFKMSLVALCLTTLFGISCRSTEKKENGDKNPIASCSTLPMPNCSTNASCQWNSNGYCEMRTTVTTKACYQMNINECSNSGGQCQWNTSTQACQNYASVAKTCEQITVPAECSVTAGCSYNGTSCVTGTGCASLNVNDCPNNVMCRWDATQNRCVDYTSTTVLCSQQPNQLECQRYASQCKWSNNACVPLTSDDTQSGFLGCGLMTATTCQSNPGICTWDPSKNYCYDMYVAQCHLFYGDANKANCEKYPTQCKWNDSTKSCYNANLIPCHHFSMDACDAFYPRCQPSGLFGWKCAGQ